MHDARIFMNETEISFENSIRIGMKMSIVLGTEIRMVIAIQGNSMEQKPNRSIILPILVDLVNIRPHRSSRQKHMNGKDKPQLLMIG